MRTRDITLLGLLIAVTAVATMVIQIPTPATQGYLNLGDSMVYVSALLFGPLAGAVAGGVGSALADWISGYGQFAPYTLIIKGVEGLLVGLIAWGLLKGRPSPSSTGLGAALLAILVGGAFMVFGYYAVETFIMGKAGLAEVPGNVIQVVGGLVVAVPVTLALRNVAPSLLRSHR